MCSVEKASWNLFFFVHQALHTRSTESSFLSFSFFFVILFCFFCSIRSIFWSGADNRDVFWSCRVKITWRLQKNLYRASFFWPGHHFVELELETDFHFLICFGLFEVNWKLKSKALQECSIALSLLFICCDFYWLEVQTNSCKEELLIRETGKADPSICLTQAPWSGVEFNEKRTRCRLFEKQYGQSPKPGCIQYAL